MKENEELKQRKLNKKREGLLERKEKT